MILETQEHLYREGGLEYLTPLMTTPNAYTISSTPFDSVFIIA